MPPATDVLRSGTLLPPASRLLFWAFVGVSRGRPEPSGRSDRTSLLRPVPGSVRGGRGREGRRRGRRGVGDGRGGVVYGVVPALWLFEFCSREGVARREERGDDSAEAAAMLRMENLLWAVLRLVLGWLWFRA